MTDPVAEPASRADPDPGAASNLDRAGGPQETLASLRVRAAERPDDPDAQVALGQAAASVFDWPAAEAAFTRWIEIAGEGPDVLFSLAEVQIRRGRYDAAIDSLTRFFATAENDARIESAGDMRVRAARKAGRYDLAEAFAREGLAAFPDNAQFHRVVGEALLSAGDAEAAEPWLVRALELMPQEVEARALLRTLRARKAAAPDEGARKAKSIAWPSRFSRFGDFKEVIRRSVLRVRPGDTRFITPQTTFLTLGSCFANNLAGRLSAAGYAAHTEFIGEEVNSTYANRFLLEWIENGVIDAQTRAMHEAYGEDMRHSLRTKFAACEVFVFTLGLAAAYFDRTTGEFYFMNGRSGPTTSYLRNNFEMRTTSVAENRDNIRHIAEAVWRLAGPETRIILTVSPVPLGATTEFHSAVIADCLSKSTLRVACHEALQELASKRVAYWPSFEIVRWLGAHFGHDFEPAFGVDDGNNRHVSTWLVDTIIDLFLETYSREPTPPERVSRL